MSRSPTASPTPQRAPPSVLDTLPKLPVVPLGARQYVPTPPLTHRPRGGRSLLPQTKSGARTHRPAPKPEPTITIGAGTQGLRGVGAPEPRGWSRIELDTESSRSMAEHHRGAMRLRGQIHKKWMMTHPALHEAPSPPKDRVGSPRVHEAFQEQKQKEEAKKERREELMDKRNSKLSAVRKECHALVLQARREEEEERKARAEQVRQGLRSKLSAGWQLYDGAAWVDLSLTETASLERIVAGGSSGSVSFHELSVGRESVVCEVRKKGEDWEGVVVLSDGRRLGLRRHQRLACCQKGLPAETVQRAVATERYLNATAKQVVKDEQADELEDCRSWARLEREREKQSYAVRRERLTGASVPPARKSQPAWQARLNREMRQERQRDSQLRQAENTETRQRNQQRKEDIQEHRQRVMDQRRKALHDDLAKERKRRVEIEWERFEGRRQIVQHHHRPRSQCSSPRGLQLSNGQARMAPERNRLANQERERAQQRSYERFRDKERDRQYAGEMRDMVRSQHAARMQERQDAKAPPSLTNLPDTAAIV
eukprot:Hpha_TRINITY_DN12846_c0_g2::TRINITY_DN12846_c0_g2_i1::g.24184::m.24184